MSLPHKHGNEMKAEDLKLQLNNITDFEKISEIMKQLGDTNRVRIFWLLCHMEECVINISSLMDMSCPAVSHHLNKLKSGGLITSRRDGKEVYYKASDTPLVNELHLTIEQITEFSCSNNFFK